MDKQQAATVTASHTLDCSRLLCPMPVIKTQNKLKELSSGDILKVICTDPGTWNDIPTWCRINQFQIIESFETPDKEIIFMIKA